MERLKPEICNDCIFKDVVGMTVVNEKKVPIFDCTKGNDLNKKEPCYDYESIQLFYETLSELIRG